MAFQDLKGKIIWKAHFRSSPSKVYNALAKAEERKKFWADSVKENNGVLTYEFKSMNFVDQGRILEQIPDKLFSVEYLGSDVTFQIEPDNQGGTDLTLTVDKVSDENKVELIAGWVNWLMTMKAAVDFDIDLRNHDPERTWSHGYVEN